MSNHIVKNSIVTPDGTELWSKHTHDYLTHIDANGEEYMNDGGNSYLRRSLNEEAYTDTSVYSDDTHILVREAAVWGTYNRQRGNPPVFVQIHRLSNAHIEAILETERHISPWRREMFLREVLYRDDNNITVEETDHYESAYHKDA